MPLRLGLTVLAAALTIAAPPALATDTVPPALFAYAGFTNPSDAALSRVGRARVVPPALRLVERGDQFFAGGAWYGRKVDVSAGWQTRFEWQLSRAAGDSPEGLAFVIQDESSTALGAAGHHLGYAGISRSVAVAVDTTPDAALGQPAAPFISVQSRGIAPNSADFAYSLGSATAAELRDGRPHVITVRYRPGAGLAIHLDDAPAPILTVPGLDLATALSPGGGFAWIGFTASNGGSSNVATADISSWSFGPLAAPARLAITSPPVSGTATSLGTMGPIVMTLEDADGNPVIAPSALDVTLRSSSSRGVFSVGQGAPSLSSVTVTIPAGQSSATVFYGDAIAGTPTITAAADGLDPATQGATIAPGPRARIRLDPIRESIVAGTTATYTVETYDSYGNDLSPDGVTLKISPDGSCSGRTCTAAIAGPHTVTATDGPVFERSELTVLPGATASIALSPASASVAAGERQTYTVHGFDAFGNDRGPAPVRTWTIGPDGSCSGGACTAAIAGPHTVTATDGEFSASADLTVRPGPTASIRLSPGDASIAAGTQQQYTVEGVDAFGNVRGKVQDADLTIGHDGSCSATACSAVVAGRHTVIATSAQFKASATLNVGPGPLAGMRLSPAIATITAGEGQRYSIAAADAFGNAVAMDDVTLDIEPDGSCSGDVCTAAAPGPHTVTVSAGALKATAKLVARARETEPATTAPAPAPATSHEATLGSPAQGRWRRGRCLQLAGILQPSVLRRGRNLRSSVRNVNSPARVRNAPGASAQPRGRQGSECK